MRGFSCIYIYWTACFCFCSIEGLCTDIFYVKKKNPLAVANTNQLTEFSTLCDVNKWCKQAEPCILASGWFYAVFIHCCAVVLYIFYSSQWFLWIKSFFFSIFDSQLFFLYQLEKWIIKDSLHHVYAMGNEVRSINVAITKSRLSGFCVF